MVAVVPEQTDMHKVKHTLLDILAWSKAAAWSMGMMAGKQQLASMKPWRWQQHQPMVEMIRNIHCHSAEDSKLESNIVLQAQQLHSLPKLAEQCAPPACHGGMLAHLEQPVKTLLLSDAVALTKAQPVTDDVCNLWR
jgi:hypothetical protein